MCGGLEKDESEGQRAVGGSEPRVVTMSTGVLHPRTAKPMLYRQVVVAHIANDSARPQDARGQGSTARVDRGGRVLTSF